MGDAVTLIVPPAPPQPPPAAADTASPDGSLDWIKVLDATQQRLDELGVVIPDPFNLAQFAAGVSARLGIRIRMVAVSGNGAAGCFGATWRQGSTQFAYYEQGMSVIHGWHNGLHELGHIILDHPSCDGFGPREAEADAVAALVLSRYHPSRPTPCPPAHLRTAAERLTRAWG